MRNTGKKNKSHCYRNKHITAWKMLCMILIHYLIRIEKFTRSLRLLVCFSDQYFSTRE